MYGAIMRAKIKAGQQEAFRRYAQEQGGPDAASGWVSSEFAVEDKDPNRIVGVIRFKDKESYVKNANAPRTNENYNQMMKFFEAAPGVNRRHLRSLPGRAAQGIHDCRSHAYEL